MTLIGGETEVVGVIGRLGEDVVMLELFCVVDRLVLVEFVKDLEVVILEDDVEPLRLELEDMDLELDVDLLEICVLVCCCSCCRHFALRFLNQTWWQKVAVRNYVTIDLK